MSWRMTIDRNMSLPGENQQEGPFISSWPCAQHPISGALFKVKVIYKRFRNHSFLFSASRLKGRQIVIFQIFPVILSIINYPACNIVIINDSSVLALHGESQLGNVGGRRWGGEV